MNIKQRLKEQKIIILDGAMGTELQRRGIPTTLPLWSAQALIDHPRVVQKIHEDYIEAGAEIITVNSFRTNVRTIKRAGIKKTARELTKTAVRLAKAAVQKSKRIIFIAGSLAPVEDCYSPALVPNSEELMSEHRLLAKYLEEAGVDLILVETMNTLREAHIAAEAALETGLPVFVSLVVGHDERLLSGESLAESVKALGKLKISALLLNCFSPTISIKPLKTLLDLTKLPVGIYANGIGRPDDDQGWEFSGGKGAREYLTYAKKWARMGARIIGGCCGTTPQYISLINRFINPAKSKRKQTIRK